MSQNNDPLNPYRNNGGVSLDESRGFSGINLWTDAQDLPTYDFLDAQNVVNLDGRFFVRPGLLGLFGGTPPSSSSSSSGNGSSSSSLHWNDVGQTSYAVPSGGASYGLDYLIDPSGNAWIIFINGGKIYKTQEGAGSYTELLDVTGLSYNFNGALTDSCKVGNFLYIVDGAHPTTRLTLSGGYPAYAMYAPGAVVTTPPSNNPKLFLKAQLTNQLLFQANSASNWSFDGQATPLTNIAPNAGQDISGNLIIINGSNLRGNGWVTTNESGPRQGGISADQINLDNPAVNVCVAGAPPSGASAAQGGLITVAPLTGGATPLQTLYPSRFHVLIAWAKNVYNPGTPQPNTRSAQMILTPYDSSGLQCGAGVIIPIGNQTTTVGLNLGIDTIADFSGLGPIVAGLTCQITAVNTNGTGNLYVGPISITPITTQITFRSGATSTTAIPSISGGAVTAGSSSSSSPASSLSSGSAVYIPSPPSDLGSILDLQLTSFIFSFPLSSSSSSSSSNSSSSSGQPIGGINLATTNRIVIGIGTGQIASWGNAAFNLWLQNGINGQWILADNGVTISSDLTGLDCDISTLPAADLTNIVALRLQFQANIAWASPFPSLPLGPITSPGNLSIPTDSAAGGGALYAWYYTETAIIDALNQIESSPSLISAYLSPTFANAEAVLTLPSLTPWNAPTDQYNFYRLGGSDAYPILVASVSSTVSIPYGSDPNNPYYGWNAVTGVFTDNTPDLFLSTAPLLSFSKDPMPSNIAACSTYQGRFCGTVGNQLYFSWLDTQDPSAALMTTYIQNSSDPNEAIAGANFPVNPDTSDTTVRLVEIGTPIAAGNQFGGVLVALNQRSIYFIQGSDATDFSSRAYPYAPGVGLTAFRGVARISSTQMYFMGPDRLHVCPPEGYEYYSTGVEADNPQQDIGLKIKPALYPSPPFMPLQNSTAFAKSSMTWYGSKLILSVPQPSTTSNNVVWIYDFLVPGWVRWLGPQSGSSSSSSSSASSNSSSSSGTLPVSQIAMAFTGAMQVPPIPGTTGAAYNLYFFGLNGQIFENVGPVDQATPNSPQNAIPWMVQVHGMRPGFFVRYKKRPLYYMRGTLVWFEVDLVMTGVVEMVSQAFTAGIQTPVPIPGAINTQNYQLASLGRPFTVYLPGGLINGDMVTVTLSGAVSAPAYLRGLRGWIAQSDYEHT
jgi:hypothetical protein